VHHDFHWLLVATKLLTAELHSRSVGSRKLWKGRSRKILEARSRNRIFCLRIRKPGVIELKQDTESVSPKRKGKCSRKKKETLLTPTKWKRSSQNKLRIEYGYETERYPNQFNKFAQGLYCATKKAKNLLNNWILPKNNIDEKQFSTNIWKRTGILKQEPILYSPLQWCKKKLFQINTKKEPILYHMSKTSSTKDQIPMTYLRSILVWRMICVSKKYRFHIIELPGHRTLTIKMSAKKNYKYMLTVPFASY